MFDQTLRKIAEMTRMTAKTMMVTYNLGESRQVQTLEVCLPSADSLWQLPVKFKGPNQASR